jgi:2-amino-4-hydroxy-6-hydroxymethyldihydropteridine diphosphokinase
MNDTQREASPAFIGLGSNLDNPAAQIERAFELLAAVPDTELLARSSMYRSAPFGPVEQPDFVNAVAQLMTFLDAAALLLALQHIERVQGRIRNKRWGPRVLDLDLLVFADQRIEQANLTVPHPGIAERNFVLLPLREIAPELVIPGLGCVAEIAVNETEPRISVVQ